MFIKGNKKQDKSIISWTDDTINAFEEYKQQITKIGWQTLGYFSRKLQPAQKKYSTYDRELLAVYAAKQYFRHMI